MLKVPDPSTHKFPENMPGGLRLTYRLFWTCVRAVEAGEIENYGDALEALGATMSRLIASLDDKDSRLHVAEHLAARLTDIAHMSKDDMCAEAEKIRAKRQRGLN